MGLFILTGLSLGLFWPWASVALQRYKIGNTWLGDRQLTFHGRGFELLKYWLVVLVLAVAGVVLFSIFMAVSISAGNTEGDPLGWAGSSIMAVAAYASLIGAGVEPGERVAVLISNRPEWAIAVFAGAQVGAIVTTHHQNLYNIREDTAPLIHDELEAMGDEIEAILTPEQSEEWLEMRDHLRDRWGGPPGMRGPPGKHGGKPKP